MNNVYFAIALHFHQPVGNFEHIFERSYQLCYKPFLEFLSNYPDIVMTLHFSGCLIDYLEEKHPEILDLVGTMVNRNQIEIIGGGYYEPILPALPERDLIGQIKMMSEYVKKKFGKIPQGMWIAERVWEPRLAKSIYKSGIKYSILDDTHFLRAGIKKEDMYGYFLTGEKDKKIAIFPSDKTLRYSMPFKLVHETIDYFRNISQAKNNMLFTYGDDAEKFGEWPGTHEWVYGKNWLKDFFKALIQNKEWIKLVKPSDYLKDNSALATTEIPLGSYEEMMGWSEGNWMNFLKKYPETNQLHKKMIYVSDKIASFEKSKIKNDVVKIKQAKKELYKSQCNCGYWHGVFGGLYLFHLRSALYNHLITADKLTDEVLHKKSKDWLDIKEVDFDSDKKIIMENNNFSLLCDPNDGGTLRQLDYRPSSFNLLNTLSRKRETYHEKILASMKEAKEKEIKTIHEDSKKADPKIKEKLIYDKFPRYSLRSYFIKQDLKLEDFLESNFDELEDFASSNYSIKEKNKSIVLEHRSRLLSLSKQIQFKSKKEIEILLTIKNESSNPINALFGIEFNITMPHLNSEQYNYTCDGQIISGLNWQGTTHVVSSFGIADLNKELGVNLEFSNSPIDLWYFPVETVSQSERAYELNFQCSCVFPRWKIALDSNRSWNTKIIWQIL